MWLIFIKLLNSFWVISYSVFISLALLALEPSTHLDKTVKFIIGKFQNGIADQTQSGTLAKIKWGFEKGVTLTSGQIASDDGFENDALCVLHFGNKCIHNIQGGARCEHRILNMIWSF